MVDNNHITSSKWSTLSSGYDMSLYNIITNGISDECDLHELDDILMTGERYFCEMNKFDDINDTTDMDNMRKMVCMGHDNVALKLKDVNNMDNMDDMRIIVCMGSGNDLPDYELKQYVMQSKGVENTYIKPQPRYKQKKYQTYDVSDELQNFFDILKNPKLVFDILHNYIYRYKI